MKIDPLPWFWGIIVVILFTLLLGASLGWKFPSISFRQKPGSKFATTYIRIDPGDYRSLVNHTIFVTNSVVITNILAAVQSAKKYLPNHPQTHWTCNIVISDSSGNTYVYASDTPTQGTIVYVGSLPNGPWFTPLRSDTLGAILEKAVTP